MATKVPEGFLFAIKPTWGITHEREDPNPQMEQFTAALAALTVLLLRMRIFQAIKPAETVWRALGYRGQEQIDRRPGPRLA